MGLGKTASRAARRFTIHSPMASPCTDARNITNRSIPAPVKAPMPAISHASPPPIASLPMARSATQPMITIIA